VTELLELLIRKAQAEFQNLILEAAGQGPAPPGNGAEPGEQGKDGSRVAGPVYVPTSVKAIGFRSDSRPTEPQFPKIAGIDPFSFITGVRPKVLAALSPVVQTPAITGVAAEFGEGKTALVARLDAWLEERQRGTDRRRVLPIGLISREFSKCKPDQPLDKDEYLDLLFGPLLTQRQEGIHELLDQIRSGHVLLALDGLDEVFRSKRAIRHFFDGLLRHVLGMGRNQAGAEAPQFNVVVTMRTEFLRSFLVIEHEVFLELVQGKPDDYLPFNICFAEMYGFNPDHLKCYLEDSGIEHEPVARIMADEKLKSILQRPLYARLFCDLLQGKLGAGAPRGSGASAGGAVPAPLKGQPDADALISETKLSIELLRKFVEAAVRTPPDLTQKLRLIPDRLAKTAMELYEKSGGLISWMEYEEVMDCVGRPEGTTGIEAAGAGSPAGGGAAPESDEADEDYNKEMIIHKSPLLMRRDEFKPLSIVNVQEREQEKEKAAKGDRFQVRFAHRAFFEYFTALGVFNVTQRAEELEAPGKFRFERFDDLVLNVDMRKFLHEFAETRGPEEWKERTRISYGLSPIFEPEWNQLSEKGRDHWFDEAARAKLGDIRYTLLQVMTNPKKQEGQAADATDGAPSIPKIEAAIQSILSNADRWNHPLFLLPNFEAIAVYLQHYGGANRNSLRSQFDPILEKQMYRGLDWLKDTKNRSAVRWCLRQGEIDYLRKSFGLLVERCLNTGYRLQCRWAQAIIGRAASEQARKELAENCFQDKFGVIEDLRTQQRITQLLQEIAARPDGL
jgi:hypothetical protein